MNTIKVSEPVVGKNTAQLPFKKTLLSLATAGALLMAGHAAAMQSFNPQSGLVAEPVTSIAQLESLAKAEGEIRVVIGLHAGPAQSVMQGGQQTGVELAQAQSEVLSILSPLRAQTAHSYAVLPFVATKVDARELGELAAHPLVASIELDYLSEPLLADSTQLIGADSLWESGYTGQGQSVAVIDSGLNANESFFGGRVNAEACFSTHDPASGIFSLCEANASSATGAGASGYCTGPDCGHGTYVAGIIGGWNDNRSGVAPDVNITSIQVFVRIEDTTICGGAETCLRSFTSDQLRAFEYLVENQSSLKTTAVNLSLGGGYNPTVSACDTTFNARKTAIDTLRGQGVMTIAAAGNDGYTDALAAPACISSVFSVGSTLAKDTSNGSCGNGDTTDSVSCFSNSASFLDMWAPGHAISTFGPNNTTVTVSGTSMAAPHVSACVAIMREVVPSAPVSLIESALRNSGVEVTDPRNGVVKPRLDCAAAVDLLIENSMLPTPVGVQASDVGGASFKLSWSAVAGADDYIVQVARDEDFTQLVSGYADAVIEDATELLVTGLAVNTEYFARVAAKGSKVELNSDYSDAVTVTTLAVIDFSEALDNADLYFTTGGFADWTGRLRSGAVNDSAARAGSVGQGEDSWVRTTVVGPGVISFGWEIITEDLAGYFEFRIGDERRIWSTGRTVDSASYEVGEGEHVLVWRYFRSLNGVSGTAWLDNVQWTGAPRRGLEVNVTGEGSVTSSPAAIDCPDAVCKASFAQGEVVELVAHAADNWHLAEWQGACSGNTSCVVTLDELTQVTAVFAINTYRVDTVASVGGSFSPEFKDVAHGSAASFEVNAETGYHLTTIDGCDGELAGNVYTTGEITSACTISATFDLNTYTVNALVTEGGSVSPETQQALHGEQVSFTLTPSAGWEIGNVTGCGGSLAGNVYTTAPLTGSCNVIAGFRLESFDVTFNLTHLAVYQSGELQQRVTRGEAAVPPSFLVNPAYEFTGWDRNINNVTEDMVATAQFDLVDPDLDTDVTVTINIVGSGSIDTPQTQVVAWGQRVSFSATPDAGAKLGSFVGGTCPAGEWTNGTYTTGPLLEDCSLRVTFNDGNRRRSLIIMIIANDEHNQ